MLPVVVWIAGLLTAAASSADRGRTHRDLLAAVGSRLGVKIPGVTGGPAPVSPGVPVWVWPDGHRIVRLVDPVAVSEVCAHLKKINLPGSVDWDDILDAVRPSRSDPMVPQYEGLAVFVYLDDLNRFRAILTVDQSNRVISTFLGTGDAGQICGGVACSRMFQFIQDHELTDTLENETALALWYDTVLVPEGILEVLTAAQDGLDFRHVAESYDSKVVRYAEELENLIIAYGNFLGMADQMSEVACFDPMSIEFWHYLRDTDWNWRVKDMGFDPDDVSAAYEALERGDSSEMDTLLNRGFEPKQIKSIEIEMLQDVMSSELSDLRKQIQREVPADLMVWHSFVDNSTLVSRSKCLEYNVSTKYVDRWGHWDSNIVNVSMAFSSDDRPYWDAGGYSYDEVPGFLYALMRAGFLQTESGLYNAYPEDTSWTWPGEVTPALEVNYMLGASFDIIETEIVEFVRQARSLGLLPVQAAEVWRTALGG